MAFTSVYCLAGLIIGALVDRYPAKRILYVGVTVWSLAVAAMGLARNYWTMIASRMVTAIGEGGVGPSGQVLISTMFPKERIALPMTLFSVAGAIGLGASYFFAGQLLEMFSAKPFPGLDGLAPWRQVLVVIAMPGVLIAFLAFTMLESRPLATQKAFALESWRAFGAFLRTEQKLFIRMGFGNGLIGVVNYAIYSWAPTYGRRVLDMSPSEVGNLMGSISLVGGIIGAVIYGSIVDRQVAKGKTDFALTAYVYSLAITIPACVVGFTLDIRALFIAAIVTVQCILSMGGGSALAAAQIATPPEMRGRVGALMVIMINLFGYAFGPMLVGALTDFVFGDPQKVGYSIAVTILVVGPIAMWCCWSARPYFMARVAATTPR
jgi:MFS family permease